MRPTPATSNSARQHLDFADAALNLAGGEVTDPHARELMRQVAAGELSGDEAARLLVEHFRG